MYRSDILKYINFIFYLISLDNPILPLYNWFMDTKRFSHKTWQAITVDNNNWRITHEKEKDQDVFCLCCIFFIFVN